MCWQPRTGARGPRAREGGWSLLESVIALTILAVGVIGISTVICSSLVLVTVNRETALAMEAGRQTVEEIARLVPFNQIFLAYNSDPEDDPVGVECPGVSFEVPGLRPSGEIATGTIAFPVSVEAPGTLREDLQDPDLGMPMDLDRDGVIDEENHALDYRLLPVAVRVSWRGVAGPRTATYRTFLAER